MKDQTIEDSGMVSSGTSGFSSVAPSLFGAIGMIGSSAFSKPQTTIYQEAPRPQNNNLLYGAGAVVILIIVLVVVKMK